MLGATAALEYVRPMEETTTATSLGWSGVARAAVGGEVVEEVSAGFAAGPDGPPCSPDLRFQAGSISKLVLSSVALKLSESSQLTLDDPISRWWHEAPRHWSPITLRQLIGQTSGLGHWGDIPGLGASSLTEPPSRDELAAMILRAPLLAAPGERWTYSGPGFLVAALVVEAVTGDDYGVVARDLVLGPAGMAASTSGRFPDLSAGTALGHRHGAVLPVHEGFIDIPGTGDLWTTVGDLLTLSRALRGGDVLSSAAASQLWTPHSTLASPPGEDVVVIHAYGYGTFLGVIGGSPARIHPGDNPGYQSLLAYVPEHDLDIAVLCNEEAPSVTQALRQLTCLGTESGSGSGVRGEP